MPHRSSISVPSTGTNPSISSNFSLDSSTTCPQVNTAGPGGTLDIGSSCNYDLDFAPTTTGTINGSLVLSGNLLSGTETIPLSGNGMGGGAMLAMLLSVPGRDGVHARRSKAVLLDHGLEIAAIGNKVTGENLVGPRGRARGTFGDLQHFARLRQVESTHGAKSLLCTNLPGQS